jgi:hypothetical protein
VPSTAARGGEIPLLMALLAEEPHMVVPKGSKPQKGRAGIRKQETLVTHS